jgi:hypothetical protein
MKRVEPWFVRLSIPTVACIERVMEDYRFKSRADFVECALAVLTAVKTGGPLPACLQQAKDRKRDTRRDEGGGTP